MKITKTAIKRGVTFLMLYLIAIGFGLFSLARLNVDLYPKMEFPMIAVITQYTGVSPFDIETVVTRPIEETVASVQNVKKVASTTRQGLSLVMLEFEPIQSRRYTSELLFASFVTNAMIVGCQFFLLFSVSWIFASTFLSN